MGLYAIVGYGNLGRSVERLLIKQGAQGIVFSRRGSECNSTLPVFTYNAFSQLWGEIDCALLCVGSAEEAMDICPEFCRRVNTVDCYDNHEQMKTYFDKMNRSAVVGDTTAIVGCGWDPGILSLMRTLFSAFARPSTFWGEGVSMGHTNAVKSLAGVTDAVCYTVPDQLALSSARLGEHVTQNDAHKRLAYVAVREDCDRGSVARSIIAHRYFADYQTEIIFVTNQEITARKKDAYHCGRVLGATPQYYMEYCLSLKNNADFTARVMLAYTSCIASLARKRAYTLPQIPISCLTDDVFAYI